MTTNHSTTHLLTNPPRGSRKMSRRAKALVLAASVISFYLAHYWWSYIRPLHATLKGNGGIIYCVAYSAQGDFLAAGNFDGDVSLWDSQTGLETCPLQGHSGPILTVAFSPDGQFLASGGCDNTVRVWNLTTRTTAIILDDSPAAIESIAFSGDGKL